MRLTHLSTCADLEECKEKGESEEDLRVPLLLRNKPPPIEGREDDELADVDLRPESVC